MSIIQKMHRSLAIVGLLASTTLFAYATEPTPAASTAAAPPIGTRDTVRADPHVPRPSGTPCVVELVRNLAMNTPTPDWPPEPGAYAPPADCPGPWAKVILKVAFFNEAPDSYLDGFVAAKVLIGDVDLRLPLYSGGAQDNDVPTHWRAERDVTDYSAILRAPGFSRVEIEAETRFGGFSSPYYVSATLLFYPVNAQNKAPRVPDAVYPVATSLVLPRNVERAYLDVIAQAHFDYDQFWFTCMPDTAMTQFPELSSPLGIGAARYGLEGEPPPQGCGSGSFREVQVSIDGQPAGVAPVFPRFHPQFNAMWTTTRLLQPLPTPQALNSMPYRVDLTPFAGLLSDGAPHTVDISVAGSDDVAYFQLSGVLLIYRDAGVAQTTGVVTRNTLAGQPPTPSVTSTLARDASGAVGGSVATSLRRNYVIEGYIDTSRGRILSTVERTIRFENLQVLRARDAPGDDADEYSQSIELKSTVEGKSRRYLGDSLIAEDKEYTGYPLSLIYHFGSAELQQGFKQRTERWRPGVTRYYTNLSNEVDLAYTDPDVSGGNTEWRGHQVYAFRDSYSSCYRTELTTEGGALTTYQRGKNCPNNTNRLYWASHPDGSPDGLGWAER